MDTFMGKVFFRVLLLFLFFSCSKIEKPLEEVPVINFKLEFDNYFKNNYQKTFPSTVEIAKIDSIRWIDSFYETNNFKSIWINDSIDLSIHARSLIDSFSNAEHYGLTPSSYQTASLIKLSKELSKIENKSARYDIALNLEALLTNSYLLYGKHLHYGVLNVIDSITVLPRKKFRIDMPNYLTEAYKKDSLIEKLLELQPHIPQYEKLQKGLVTFLGRSSMSTDNVIVENFRKDSVKAIIQSKKALILHKYLDSVENDSLYHLALKKFQSDHALNPDGLIGKNTAQALSMSPYDYYLKIVANLEMWRWKEPLEKTYIFVNIPAYRMRLYENTKTVLESKVVVGKKKTTTPEIRDSLRFIIAYPYWNVPRKISVKEIVVKAQKDSTYFGRNNYELLTYTKEPVDVSTIDWNDMNEDTFTYLIRQKGGGSNSLGLVKFIFPNKHAIYLHDTPAKSLFSREVRAFSHGCVRVEKAMPLAKHLLVSDENKYNIDTIYKYIDKKNEKPFKLNKTVPVYLYYFTTDTRDNGDLIFYHDIYGIDRKLTHLLIQQRNRFNFKI